MYKRGQVTIFIIIGIIIVFLFAGILFITKNKQSELEVDDDIYSFGSIEQYIDSCLKRVAEESVKEVSSQGGYNYVPRPSQEVIFTQIPYYYYLGEENFPSKLEIKQSMEEFVLNNLNNCLDDFSIFEESGYVIKQTSPNVNVEFRELIIFDLTYPLIISYGTSTKDYQTFTSLVPVNMNHVYSILQRTFEKQQQNKNSVPIGYISADSSDQNYTFELNYLEEDAVVYSLIFDQYRFDNEDYIFSFANKYDWSDLSSSSLDYSRDVEDKECYVGDECRFYLNIYEEDYLFEEFTDLFEISKDGLISFTPEEKDLGVHMIAVKVSSKGSVEYLTFKLEVIKSLE